MGKIRLFIASSLDSYIARLSGAIDWLFDDPEEDYGYHDFLAQVDTVLMGYKTYEQVLTLGDYPYRHKRSFVFSRSRHGQQDDHVQFVGQNLAEFATQLQQSDRESWLVGGAEIIRFFLQHHCIDELILSIHPRILGSGIPLVIPDPTVETSLTLKAAQPYASGLLQVTYALDSPEPSAGIGMSQQD